MTTGRTSEPTTEATTHRVELVERHAITMPTLSGNPHAAWARASEAALEWAAREGLKVDVYALSGSGPEGPHYGAVFDVHVGHAKDDAWTWSVRAKVVVERMLVLLERPRPKLASVTRLGTERARAQADATVPGLGELPVDQRPPWMKRADGHWDEDQ